MPTRLLMTCTGPGSDWKKAAAGRNPQSGSLQPAMLVGTAGGLETTPPVTVLLAPVLVTTPEPLEFVMVPVLVPNKAPTVLLAPVRSGIVADQATGLKVGNARTSHRYRCKRIRNRAQILSNQAARGASAAHLHYSSSGDFADCSCVRSRQRANKLGV